MKTNENQNQQGVNTPVVMCSFNVPISEELYKAALKIVETYHEISKPKEPIMLSDLYGKINSNLYFAIREYLYSENIEHPAIKDIEKIRMWKFRAARGNGKRMAVRFEDFCEEYNLSVLP